MNNITAKLKEIEMLLDTEKLAKVGADYMRSITPIHSGNARKKTYHSGNTIVANYPYAGRLDEGHSDQYLGELVKPTEDYLQNYIKQGNK